MWRETAKRDRKSIEGWGPAIPMPALRHNPRREGIPAHRKGLRALSRARPWRAPRTCSASARQRVVCGRLAPAPSVGRLRVTSASRSRFVRPLAGSSGGPSRLRGGLAGSSRHTLAAGVCRGGAGWAVSRRCPALLAALWVVVAALQECLVLLGRGSSFPLPPRKARDTQKERNREPARDGRTARRHHTSRRGATRLF